MLSPPTQPRILFPTSTPTSAQNYTHTHTSRAHTHALLDVNVSRRISENRSARSSCAFVTRPGRKTTRPTFEATGEHLQTSTQRTSNTKKNCPAIELLVRTVFRPHCALLTKSLLLRNVCFGIEGGVGVDVIPYIESGWGADVHASINNRTGIGIAQRSRGGMVGA